MRRKYGFIQVLSDETVNVALALLINILEEKKNNDTFNILIHLVPIYTV